LLTGAADLDQFRLRGPYEVNVQPDRELALSDGERVTADVYLSAPGTPAPLVVILHGYDNSKDDHGYQALHLATWGMHSLALQLPNNGPWIRNGEILTRIVALLRNRPEVIDPRIDPNRIVLVGHSFGATSVAVALAADAPVLGGVLLDPAGVSRTLPQYLKKIRKPVMVIASDAAITHARRREEFYEYVPAEIAEVSIRGAHHEDAQFRLEPTVQGIASDASATEELQITFASALTAVAFSLGFTGKLDYAWDSFGTALRDGKLFDALRK